MFWASCSSGGGGWVDGMGGGLGVGGWGWGWLGGVPHTCAHACTCMHAHAHTRAHGKHDNFMQMAASTGFMGNPWAFPMMSYAHACACACMHVHMCRGHPLTSPTPSTHPPAPQWGTLRISQNSIVLELIEIFQFCLKI